MKTKNIITGTAMIFASLLPIKEIKADPLSLIASVTARDKYLSPVGFEVEKEPALQSSLVASKNNFYIYTWNNVNLDRKVLTEYDLGLGYSRNFQGVNTDLAYNLFDFRNLGDKRVNDNLQEAWLVLSRKSPFSPRLKLVQNISAGTFDNSKGQEVSLSLNESRNVGRIPVSLDAHFHYNNHYFIEGSGVSVVQAEASMPLSYRGVSINPSFKFQKAVKKDFDDKTGLSLMLNYDFKRGAK
ncbi:hypothetical protein HYT57_03490 [Candidatus Woesearchaeota archaeon]|nr:hypothetical protein [Candidatus Woesearchaeota archaeon]